MKKLLAAILTLVMVLAPLTGCGENGEETGGGTEGEVYQWSLGTIYSDPATSTVYNAFGEWVEKFTQLVSEKTGGRVEITPYYNSVLGSANEMYEQARRNEIQVFCSQPMSTVDPRFGMMSIPGLFSDYDMVKALFTDPESELFQLMAGAVSDTGLTMLANNIGVFRVFYNSKHPVAAPDDVSDLTVRIYEDTICSEYWAGLCPAVSIPYSEMFMSLQTGVVDGAEHTMSAGPSQLYEVCGYCSDINWQWTWGGPVIVNSEAFNSLPEDLQQAVREAAVESCAFYDDLWVEYNAACEAEMSEVGIDYYKLSDAERAAWEDYARSLDSKFVEIVGEDFYNQAIEIVNNYNG